MRTQHDCVRGVRLLCIAFVAGMFSTPTAGQDDEPTLARYRQTALTSGDASRGKAVFESQQAACTKCHAIGGKKRLAGPDLGVVGDKYTREQLIQAVLEPSANIHPDYATLKLIASDGKPHIGVLRHRTNRDIVFFNAEGKLTKLPLSQVDEQHSDKVSLMPAGLFKSVAAEEFADLIAYLTTLKQNGSGAYPGLPAEIPEIARPIRLEPFHTEEMRFDHPVWITVIPGSKSEFLVIEQRTRKIWRLVKSRRGDRKTLFADLRYESIAGAFSGVMCLAFHPDFWENRKYYLHYHVREDGIFSPVIVERTATVDFSRDVGGASKRLLKINQTTDLHWGGMLAFGPDGYLYIGTGDGGPQEDPDGHGQDLSQFMGKILRIDVDHADGDKPYAIPDTNPFKDAGGDVRAEIWAYGFRMPWRFSWDPKTKDLWVGGIGQDLFEEVSIVRVGENHGWNVYEGFTPFSNRYRRGGETFTPPVLSYRRKHGVSVTGGYVYRGDRSPSYSGVYIFGDFMSKRIFALTQADRKLIKVRQIGVCPERPSSFGIDPEGELFVVGFEGTIYRLILDDSIFE